jgi:hypothetical protein
VPLTLTSIPVRDGANQTVTASTYTDGTRTGPAVAVLGADGTHFQPAMDAPARPGYVAKGDGADAALGATTDAAAAAGDVGTVSAKLRLLTAQIQALLALVNGGLPAALSAGGGLKVGLADALPAGTAVVGKLGIDQTTPGTTDSVSVKSQGYAAKVVVTRPNNSAPYAAGDVVGDQAGSAVITFPNCAPAAGGHVVLSAADLLVGAATPPSGMGSFRLYLYDAAPPSAPADNAPWALPSGDRAAFLGYVDLGTPAALGGALFCQVDGSVKKVKTVSGTLYGILVTNGGYVPGANETYQVRLNLIGV